MPQAAAFFPVYPAVVHVVAWATGSILVAGVLVSLASGAVAAWVLAQIARPLLGERGARDTVLYLALYPVAFVAVSLYSEGLFLASRPVRSSRRCAAGRCSRRARRPRDRDAADRARAPPALALLLWRGRDRSLARLAPLLLLPAAVGLYALYLDWAIGDPWAFTSAQADWDRDVPARPAGGDQGRDPLRRHAGCAPARPAAGGQDTTSASASGTSPTWRSSPRRPG